MQNKQNKNEARHFKGAAQELPSIQQPLPLPTDANERKRKKPKKNVRRIISNLLLAIGIILLLVAGGMYAYSQFNYYEAEQNNEKLAKFATIQENTSDAPKVDWAGLKAINGDVRGWLYIPGTTINYPIYQGKDNEHYLRHAATGEWIIAGQLFLDYQNTAPGLVDQQSIIYGHHLLNGTMFEQIAAMDKQDKFDEIKTVWYATENQSYELEPLFMYFTDPYNYDVRTFNFESEEKFHEYLQGFLDKAVTKRSDAQEILGKTKHVLSLITCNYYDGYGRSVLVCVPKAEANS